MPALTLTSSNIILELNFTMRATHTSGLSHLTCLSAASASSIRSFIAYLIQHESLPWNLQCQLVHLRSSLNKFMRIWHTFAMQTVRSFCQTNLLPLPLIYRHLWTAQFRFDFPWLINGWRHILRMQIWALSLTFLVNPSNINSSTLNMVSYIYLDPICQSQIVIKDGFLSYPEPVQEKSSYTHLLLVPSEFYNIIFIVFHSNAISGILTPIAHSTEFNYATTGQGCTPTSNKLAMPAHDVPLQTLPRASPSNWFTISQSKRHSFFFLSMHTPQECILASVVLRHT